MMLVLPGDRTAQGSARIQWLELPRPGALGETVIGAAEEHPTRLVRYDLAQRKRSVEVRALDDYAVSADGAWLAYRIGQSLALPPETQTLLSNEYGTISIAIALTLVIFGRKH
jgi:hypothetical protein